MLNNIFISSDHETIEQLTREGKPDASFAILDNKGLNLKGLGRNEEALVALTIWRSIQKMSLHGIPKGDLYLKKVITKRQEKHLKQQLN